MYKYIYTVYTVNCRYINEPYMDPVGLSCWASLHLPSLLQKGVNWWRLLWTFCTNNTMNTYPNWTGSKIDFKRYLWTFNYQLRYFAKKYLIIVHLVEGNLFGQYYTPQTILVVWNTFSQTSPVFIHVNYLLGVTKKITSRWLNRILESLLNHLTQDAPWDWNIFSTNLP